MLLNFTTADAGITLFYTKDGISQDENGDPIREQSIFTLNFNGNRVNVFDNTYNFPFIDGDEINGDQNLYVKGGEGSVAIINLFNGDENGESPDYYSFKNEFVETTGGDGTGEFVRSKRLVNEAHLVFNVNQDIVNGEEPDRLFLYDAINEVPLIDYFLDRTGNPGNPELSKAIHLVPLQREDDEPNGLGIKYKIRITEHINNLLLRDSTNVKLGLSLSGNVNIEENTNHFKILTSEDNLLQNIPISSIITPRGTVLHGNSSPMTEMRPYLEIFYTEPDN